MFEKKTGNNYEEYENWTPKIDTIDPKCENIQDPRNKLSKGGKNLKLLGEARRAMDREEDLKSYTHHLKQSNSKGCTGFNQNTDLEDAVFLEYYKDWLNLQEQKEFRK